MERDELVAALRREGAMVAEAAATDMDAAIPTCPPWDERQLLNHLGRVHRWAIAHVAASATQMLAFPPKPETVDVEWFRAGVDELADLLSAADPETLVWNFVAGAPQPARFWIRRQAVETAIHRVDAQLAFAKADPIDTELAIAGVDEALDVFLSGRPTDLGGSVHFHATDSPHGEWVVRTVDGGLLAGHGHEKADVAMRASAGDLLLWLWGRDVDADRLEIFGDTTILDNWRTNLKIA